MKKTALMVCAVLIFQIFVPVGFAEETVPAYAVFWVDAVYGSDFGSGDNSSPFKTIQRAKEAVRGALASMNGDIYVYINDGEYFVGEAITFGPEDSGKNGYRVIYSAAPGANPVITGGKAVMNWVLFDAENNIYKADIPKGAELSRQFYIDGERQIRSNSETTPFLNENVTGGEYRSELFSDPNTSLSLTFDLEWVQNCSLLKLFPGTLKDSSGTPAGFPSDFTVELSEDNIDYNIVGTFTNEAAPSSGGYKSYALTSQKARYVRLRATRLGAAAVGENGRRLVLSEAQILSSYTQDDFLGVNSRTDYTKNLAYQKGVTVEDQNPNFLASNLTDGDLSTSAATQLSRNSASSFSMTINLDGFQAISAVRLYGVLGDNGEYINEPVDFKLEGFSGSTWDTLKNVSGANWIKGEPIEVNFPPALVSQIRIATTYTGIGHGLQGPYLFKGLQLSEFEVYGNGRNLALGKPATSNNSWNDYGFNITGLTDGLDGTAYVSSSVDPNSPDIEITIDLEEEEDIAAIRLHPRYGGSGNFHYAAELLAEVSTDGVDFKKVLHLDNIPESNGLPQEFPFPRHERARFVKIKPLRIQGDENGSYRFYLNEVEIFGPSETQQALYDNISYPDSPIMVSTSSGNRRVYSDSCQNENLYSASNLVDGLRDNVSASRGIKVPVKMGLAAWNNVQDMEVHWSLRWGHHIYKVDGSNAEGTSIYTTNGLTNGWSGNIMPTWLENAYELISRPREWYIDRRGTVDRSGNPTIYYKAPKSFDINAASAILPVTEQFILVNGTYDNPVESLTFKGLAFAYSAWKRPSSLGFLESQAGNHYSENGKISLPMPCAIEVAGGIDIRFEDNVFDNLGSGGLRIWNASQSCEVKGNVFINIASGGIFIGSIDDHHAYESDPRDIVKNHMISNNYITMCGLDYFGSPGIFIGYTEGVTVSHNEIHRLPYTGISLGYGWGNYDQGGSVGYTTPTASKNNIVEFNRVYDCGIATHDGGNIYTLGHQPSSKIRGNYFYDYRDRTDSRDAAIYLDEGSSYIEIYDNICGGAYWWGSMWTSSIKNNNWHDNYYLIGTTVGKQSGQVDGFRNLTGTGSGNTVTNSVGVANLTSNPTVSAIYNNTGLESAYSDIKTKRAHFDEPKFNNKLRLIDTDTIYRYPSVDFAGIKSGLHSSRNSNEWVILDMGNAMTVSGLTLFPAHIMDTTTNRVVAGFPVNYSIELSADGVDFTEVKSVDNQVVPGVFDSVTSSFPAQTARYVKLNVTRLGGEAYGETGYRLLLSDLVPIYEGEESYAPDFSIIEPAKNEGEDVPDSYAKYKTVYAVDGNSWEIEEYGFSVTRLTDASLNTNFYTSYSFPQNSPNAEISLDMGAVHDIAGIWMYPRFDGGTAIHYPKDMAISTSFDNINFTQQLHVTNIPNPEGYQELVFRKPVRARYVKLTPLAIGVGEDDVYRFQLVELAVLAAKESGFNAAWQWSVPTYKKGGTSAALDGFVSGNINVSINLKRIVGGTSGVIIMFLAHKDADGRLVNLACSEVESFTLGESKTLSVSLEITETGNGDKLELYFWESIEGMKPEIKKMSFGEGYPNTAFGAQIAGRVRLPVVNVITP